LSPMHHPADPPTQPVHPGPHRTDGLFASGLVGVVLRCVSVVIPLSSLSSQSGSGSWLLGVSHRNVCSQLTSRLESGSVLVVLGHTPQNHNQDKDKNTRAGTGGGGGTETRGEGGGLRARGMGGRGESEENRDAHERDGTQTTSSTRTGREVGCVCVCWEQGTRGVGGHRRDVNSGYARGGGKGRPTWVFLSTRPTQGTDHTTTNDHQHRPRCAVGVVGAREL